MLDAEAQQHPCALGDEALAALGVFRGRGDANDASSLYGLLARARSPMGKRVVKVRAVCVGGGGRPSIAHPL